MITIFLNAVKKINLKFKYDENSSVKHDIMINKYEDQSKQVKHCVLCI